MCARFPLRVLALTLELLPLAVLLVLSGSESADGASLGILLVFVTGFGWLTLGRWDIGLVIAILTGAIMIAGIVWAALAGFSQENCVENGNCNQFLSASEYVTTIGFYVLTTLVSAVMLAWHAWRVPSWVNRADE
jgi:hypothetical protein